MEKIVWSSQFSVGVEKLDNQHKKIIGIINRLISNSEQSPSSELIQETLAEMREYSLEHLQDEEQILFENDYPDMVNHKEQHGHYIERLNDFLTNPMENNDQLYSNLLAFLRVWWVRHILEEDMKYKMFLKNKGFK